VIPAHGVDDDPLHARGAMMARTAARRQGESPFQGEDGCGRIVRGCDPLLVRGASDLSALRERIPLPPMLNGRWAAARRTVFAVAGFAPVPMELVLWIPVGDGAPFTDWRVIGELLGAEGPATTIAVHVDAARAVLGARLGGLLIDGMDVHVTGPRYPATAFEGGGFTQGRAARIEGGLIVGLTSSA
jgi:hypothetical protein